MHAAFGAQRAEGVVAGDFQRGTLEPGDITRGFFEHFDGEAAAVAELQVHAFEHRRPVLRLGSAGTGLDVEEAVVGIHGIGEHAPELHPGDDFLHVGDVLADGMQRGIVVLGASHGKQVARIAQPLVEFFQRGDDGFQLLALTAQVLGAFGIIPDRGIFGELDHFGQAAAFAFEVKDTSAVPWYVNRGRRAGWRGRSGVPLPCEFRSGEGCKACEARILTDVARTAAYLVSRIATTSPPTTANMVAAQRANRDRPPTTRTRPSLNTVLAMIASPTATATWLLTSVPRLNRRRLERVMASTSVRPDTSATAYRPMEPAVSDSQAASSSTTA